VEIRTPRALGTLVRGHRRSLKMTQASLAQAAGVSRAWITEFEAGKSTVELGRVLAVLDALGIVLEARTATSTEAPRTTDGLQDLDSLLEDYDQRNQRHA
jgi:HTH-type transcriptional regulator / antitoxin HipB